MEENRYYERLAAAYLRGKALRTGQSDLLPEDILEKDPGMLDGRDLERILETDVAVGAKLYAFKNTHGDMPRVGASWGS